jgi:hypothetical protein
VVKLAVDPDQRQPRALRYRLLPEPLDLTPGNAAPQWLRAGLAIQDELHRIKPGQYRWFLQDPVAPKDWPNKEARELLARFAPALRLADQAARRRWCDWARQPLTFQNMSEDLPLHEVQLAREIAYYLGLRYYIDLQDGRLDQAIYTLQTGFALARDVGNGDTLIDNLVGIAIEAIQLGQVEQMIQTPGSPNLYWALTDLPHPLIHVRGSVEYELNTLYRSFPKLRELHKKPLSQRALEDLMGEVLGALNKMAGEDVPVWIKELSTAALVVKSYPEARRYLLARGHSAREVDALPNLQVVALYQLGQYDEVRDDIMKWMSVPPSQGLAGLERVEKKVRGARREGGNPIVGLLLPAIVKVAQAQVRTERQVAGLRCAEALRLYSATHDGKAPAAWADIKEVPLPADPITGMSFAAWYQVQDGHAVLEVPPPPGMPASLGRRYELSSHP